MSTMNAYDELTDMFQRHYVSQQQPPALHPLQHAQPPSIPQPTPEPQPITYISQHYHHSTHVAPLQRPVSTPNIDASTITIILDRHGVDASTLLPVQLSLFAQGTTAQQLRLVELWRISPPEAGGHAAAISKNFGVWPETSFEREEELARLRVETRMMEEQAAAPQSAPNQLDFVDDMMSDSEASNPPVTPILGGDGRWNQTGHVEPYMMSGYEALAAREYEASMQNGSGYARSTDPVYKTIADIHHYPNVGTYVMNDESRARTGWDAHQEDDDMML